MASGASNRRTAARRQRGMSKPPAGEFGRLNLSLQMTVG